MANGNNKSYFLLVFQRGIRLPAIISVAEILEIRPNNKQRIIRIRTKSDDYICYDDVSRFKIVTAEYIDYNINNDGYEENNQDICQ